MKSIIVFVIVCLWFTCATLASVENGDDEEMTIQPAAISDNLMDLLIEIRKRMHMEIPSLGLPILDPARLEQQMELDFDVSNLGILKGTIENVTIVGLQGFIPEQVYISIVAFPFTFNLTVPQLTVNGLYKLDSFLGNMLPLTGEGDFIIVLTNVRVAANGRLRYGLSDGWTMPELDLLMSVDKLDTQFNGLYGGNNEYEDFINLAISKLGADILDEIYPDFQPTFRDLVVSIAEDALDGVSMLELISIINGNLDLPPLDDE